MGKLIVVISILALSIISYGQTNYYVKNSGDDRNTGLSDEQAWETIAKVNDETFNPGDNIFFNRGDVWREMLTVPSSGEDGAPITFAAYGSGDNPTITGSNIVTDWTTENIGVFDIYKKFTNVRPILVYESDTRLSENKISKESLIPGQFFWETDTVYVRTTGDDDISGYTMEVGYRDHIINIDDNTYLTFENLTLRDGNDYSGGMRIGPYVMDGLIFRSCIIERSAGSGFPLANGVSSGSVEIDNCIIRYNGLHGIVIYDPIDNAIYSNNEIYYNGWRSVLTEGQVSGIQGNLGNALIFGNDIHHNGLGAYPGGSHGIYGFQSSYVTNIYNNDIYNNEHYGIKVIGDANIYNNTVYSNGATGIHCGEGALDHVYSIYYNLIFDNAWSAIDQTGKGSGSISLNIFNNTIYQHGNESVRTTDVLNSITITNNIISTLNETYSRFPIRFHEAQAGDLLIDNNIYYNPTGDVAFTGYINFSEWQALGYDASGDVVNPLLTNPVSDFGLQIGSPAINAGVDVGLTTDFYGNPIVGVPDIGAISFNQIPYTPDASFSFSILNCEAPYSVQFEDISSSGDLTTSITSYDWNFGDGNTSTSENPEHIFNSDGTFIVELNILNDQGYQDTFVDTIVLKGISPPLVDNQMHCGLESFTGIEGIGEGLKWYSNPTLSTLVYEGNFFFPEITESGTYTFYVTQTIDNCSSGSNTVIVLINENPIIDLGEDITLTNEVYELSISGMYDEYLWNDGYSGSSRIIDPTTLEVGNYLYSLTVTDQNGCKGSDTILITIDALSWISNPKEAVVGIYPNPVKNILTIETGELGVYKLDITSINGQLIYSEEIPDPIHQIDLTPFLASVYFITIRSQDYQTTRKIIKQ